MNLSSIRVGSKPIASTRTASCKPRAQVSDPQSPEEEPGALKRRAFLARSLAVSFFAPLAPALSVLVPRRSAWAQPTDALVHPKRSFGTSEAGW